MRFAGLDYPENRNVSPAALGDGARAELPAVVLTLDRLMVRWLYACTKVPRALKELHVLDRLTGSLRECVIPRNALRHTIVTLYAGSAACDCTTQSLFCSWHSSVDCLSIAALNEHGFPRTSGLQAPVSRHPHRLHDHQDIP